MLVLLGVHGYAPGIAPSTGRRAPRAHGWRSLRACASADASYIVRPPPSTPPRAIVHFLGGAFVGAAPQLAYARLLSELAADGLVVVATPYQLSFDYLALCERVLADFEPAHAALTEEYGALPLVGVGHSCGALLHVLICSLFAGGGGVASVPRAANALVSFNNKRAADAIPFFATLVAPVASGVAASPLPAAVASARGRLDALADEPAAAAEPTARPPRRRRRRRRARWRRRASSSRSSSSCPSCSARSTTGAPTSSRRPTRRAAPPARCTPRAGRSRCGSMTTRSTSRSCCRRRSSAPTSS